MEMDVKGVSPCPEPIPPAAGSGGCPHQRPHHRDGQPAEPSPAAAAADGGHPERQHSSEKEDKKSLFSHGHVFKSLASRLLCKECGTEMNAEGQTLPSLIHHRNTSWSCKESLSENHLFGFPGHLH